LPTAPVARVSDNNPRSNQPKSGAAFRQQT
jgi:hypothetical protein